ncbi:hypothetical protein [Methylobacterium sp. JK268]
MALRDAHRRAGRAVTITHCQETTIPKLTLFAAAFALAAAAFVATMLTSPPRSEAAAIAGAPRPDTAAGDDYFAAFGAFGVSP